MDSTTLASDKLEKSEKPSAPAEPQVSAELQLKFDQAKKRLVFNWPWWAACLLKLKMKWQAEHPCPGYAQGGLMWTAATDGTHLLMNPAYIDSLSEQELDGLLLHEVAHCVLRHPYRRETRDPLLWNYAADECVNALLDASGVTLPALVTPGPLTHTAEERYELIKDQVVKMMTSPDVMDAGMFKKAEKGQGGYRLNLPELEGHGEPQQGPPQSGGEALANEDDPDQMSERDWERTVKSAQGNVPAALKRIWHDVVVAPRPWQELLAVYCSRHIKGDTRNWSTVSRRAPWVTPGYKPLPAATLALVLDTSGSITTPELSKGLAEVQAIAAIQGFEVTVICADAAVQSVLELRGPEDQAQINVKGGGGTDFRPAISYAEEKIHPDVLIYYTDGAGTFPSEAPSFPVIWLLTQYVDVPFGESLRVRESA